MKLAPAVLAATAALAATACGETCSTQTPKVDHIGSCTAPPDATVGYPVQTCDEVGTACDVDLSGVGNGTGTIFLDPRTEVCDGGSASCPAGCSASQSICSFTAPAPGSYVVSAFDPCTNETKTGTLTVGTGEILDCAL